MQTERRVNPQTKQTDLGCESANNWQLPSTSAVAIYYYYSALKLIYILPEGWVDCMNVQQPMPKTVYIAVAVAINLLTAVSHTSAKYANTRPLQPARWVGVNILPKVVARQPATVESNVKCSTTRLSRCVLHVKEQEKPLKDGEIASLEHQLQIASADLQVKYFSPVINEQSKSNMELVTHERFWKKYKLINWWAKFIFRSLIRWSHIWNSVGWNVTFATAFVTD